MSVMAYERRTVGTELTFRDWQRMRVQYQEFGVELVVG